MLRRSTLLRGECLSMPTNKPLDSTSSEPLMRVSFQILDSQSGISKSAEVLLTYSDSLIGRIERDLYLLISKHLGAFLSASELASLHMKQLAFHYSISFQPSTTKESPPQNLPTSGKISMKSSTMPESSVRISNTMKTSFID